jgi:light-regulated signal transduction histidine kinase (bacteriophytochrome)
MKKAEEEILHSNIELERFAYVASHDLQEPLRMVTNFTELLQKRYGEKLDDTAKEYIDFAANGARRMQDLVNDLLEYARIGQEAESFKATDLNQTMKTIKENLKDSIDSTHAIVSYDTLPVVHTNPIRIMRVIQNLIGNSIKYQKENAQPKIIVSTAEQSGFWEISIKDNGIGMKQEYCEKIFEPFKRLHAKNEYSGTGMGLSICRKLIEGFGGKIWAHSTLGEGTVFTFTMPMYNQKQETEKDKADD